MHRKSRFSVGIIKKTKISNNAAVDLIVAGTKELS